MRNSFVPGRLVGRLTVLLWLLLAGASLAVESPTSYGPVAKVDMPILRIPFVKSPPKIDGSMAAGEWEDSSALSGFWYDYAQA